MNTIAMSLFVGMQGKFEVKAPFDKLIHPQFTYTVRSIRTLSDIINIGDDPMQVYTDNALPDQDYARDLESNAAIIGLQNASSPTIYIPESFITTIPASSGVPYRPLVLTVHLGMVPDEMNLENLEDAVKTLVLSEIGVTAKTALVAVGASELITTEEHERLKIQRETLVSVDDSQGARLLRAERENTVLKKQLQELAAALRRTL